jgi:hypothetical protein
MWRGAAQALKMRPLAPWPAGGGDQQVRILLLRNVLCSPRARESSYAPASESVTAGHSFPGRPAVLSVLCRAKRRRGGGGACLQAVKRGEEASGVCSARRGPQALHEHRRSPVHSDLHISPSFRHTLDAAQLPSVLSDSLGLSVVLSPNSDCLRQEGPPLTMHGCAYQPRVQSPARVIQSASHSFPGRQACQQY